MTEGNMISLDRYNGVIGRTDLPDGSALVEVQAGIRLRDFNDALEKMGLSLLNLGATAAQSVAGATATGTHGTGMQIGSISTQITAMRLVDSTGRVHVVSDKDEDTDIFEAARVGIGALGAISTITFKAAPLFKLRKRLIDYELPTLLKVIYIFTLLSWCDVVVRGGDPLLSHDACVVTHSVVLYYRNCPHC